jgi:hypothetical protein
MVLLKTLLLLASVAAFSYASYAVQRRNRNMRPEDARAGVAIKPQHFGPEAVKWSRRYHRAAAIFVLLVVAGIVLSMLDPVR